MRNFLKSFDAAVTGGALMRRLSASREARFRAEVAAPHDARIEIAYSKAGFSRELAELCDRYGSDKGEASPRQQPYPWPSHSYTDLYELLFGSSRQTVQLVVECGIGTNNPDLISSMGAAGKPGASLRVWQDYFPHARIIGADIDPDILFAEGRIETFQCDQTSAESIAAFREQAGIADGTVDVVIDDGLHEFHAGVAFFEGMWSALRVGGTHVIEDIVPPDAPKFADYLTRLPENASGAMVDMRSKGLPVGYNTLAVIRKTTD
jgi:SAM-dependent methyltransferase